MFGERGDNQHALTSYEASSEYWTMHYPTGITPHVLSPATSPLLTTRVEAPLALVVGPDVQAPSSTAKVAGTEAWKPARGTRHGKLGLLV